MSKLRQINAGIGIGYHNKRPKGSKNNVMSNYNPETMATNTRPATINISVIEIHRNDSRTTSYPLIYDNANLMP